MIQRWSAPLCLAAAAMLCSNGARAGVWGVDPVLGITGDYATNPGLLNIPNTAQADGALLVDAPATFNAGDLKLFVLPSFRVGDTKSYSSVNSDYEHLNVKGEFDTERSVLTASAGATRDSSLYLNYLANGQTGVRRDGVTADLNWDRYLTEKIDFSADASTMRVRYAAPAGNASLVDYKYTSITPTLEWKRTARTEFTLAATVGQYDSLDGQTRSRNANLQLGFVRPLSEIWSLTASGGYSRSTNRIDFTEYLAVTANGIVTETVPNGFVIEVIPVRLKSSEHGSVYSVNLTRRGERLTLNATGSRQEIPNGFAFLSRQITVELQASYSLSARWSLSGDARYLNAKDPQRQGESIDRTVDYLGLNASWEWTEHWRLTLGASRVTERYQSPHIELASNQVAVTLSRTFNHVSFQ